MPKINPRAKSLPPAERLVALAPQGRIDAGGLHRAGSGLDDLDRVAGDHEASARLRNEFHMLEDEAVEGLGAGGGQLPFHQAVEFADMGAAVNQIAAVRLGMDVAHRRGGVTGKPADDFFQNVFERHQTKNVPVLVHHQGDAVLLALEIQQLGVERCALGYEVRLLRNLGEGGFVEPVLGDQVDGVADVDYPFDALIDAVAIERQTGVLAGGEQPEDVVQIAVEVAADDFTARHHNVLEVEDAEQHTLVAAWNQRTRFIDHGAQLLAAELLHRRLGGRDARELQ